MELLCLAMLPTCPKLVCRLVARRAQEACALPRSTCGGAGRGPSTRPVIIDGFGKLRPDLVAFQEAVKSQEYDQVVDLLGPDFHIAHQADCEVHRQNGTEDERGVSIASRWPLGEVREVDLNVTPRTGDFAHTTLTRPFLRRSSRRSRWGRCCSSTTCPAGS